MTDIEKQALDLVNEVRAERDLLPYCSVSREEDSLDEALCRALEMLNAEREAHAATKREVSDACYMALKAMVSASMQAHERAVIADATISRFIIHDPVDPLVEAIREASVSDADQGDADRLRQALAARGGRIVFDGGEQP